MEINSAHGDIKARILSRIKSGEVSMHSRLYFAFKFALLLAVLVIALLVSILIFTFIFFTIRLNIADAFRNGGPSGLVMFVRFFPWHLLILEIILIALAECLLRSFRFGYRSPMLYLGLVLISAMLALGLFIDRDTRFNDSLRESAHHHGLPPPFNDMYEHAHRDDLFPPDVRTVQGGFVIYRTVQ